MFDCIVSPSLLYDLGIYGYETIWSYLLQLYKTILFLKKRSPTAVLYGECWSFPNRDIKIKEQLRFGKRILCGKQISSFLRAYIS